MHRKDARTVWRGAVRKGPKGISLAVYSTLFVRKTLIGQLVVAQATLLGSRGCAFGQGQRQFHQVKRIHAIFAMRQHLGLELAAFEPTLHRAFQPDVKTHIQPMSPFDL